MARPKLQAPARRYHLSGQSVVTLGGRDFYLGPHDSPEAIARYAVLVGIYQTHGSALPDDFDPADLEARVAVILGATAPSTLATDQSAQPILVRHLAATVIRDALVGRQGSRYRRVGRQSLVSRRGLPAGSNFSNTGESNDRDSKNGPILACLPPSRGDHLRGKLSVLFCSVFAILSFHVLAIALQITLARYTFGALPLEIQPALPFRLLLPLAAILSIIGGAVAASTFAKSNGGPVLCGILAPAITMAAITLIGRLNGVGAMVQKRLEQLQRDADQHPEDTAKQSLFVHSMLPCWIRKGMSA